jgi:hypothetical protein
LGHPITMPVKRHAGQLINPQSTRRAARTSTRWCG